jgi:GntR family transcriptional regulator
MLDKTTAIPIYHQLKEWLRAEIASGTWQPGDLIPSERELSEQFGISRMTVRQALNELREEGILRREQGRGTYVAEPKIEQRLTRLTGFTEDMKRRALRSGARVLRQMWVEAPAAAAKALRITPGKQIVLLQRLRMAEGEPMAIESSYLHFGGMAGLLEENFENQSLYHCLSEKYGILPTRAEQKVEAAICREQDCRLLHIEPGSPVLRNRRVTYDQRNKPFEYTDSIYRGDRYIFYVELSVL